MIAFVSTLLLAYVLIAVAGLPSADRGERVLGALDPLFDTLRVGGQAVLTALWKKRVWVGWGVTITGTMFGCQALATRRRAALPVLLFLAALVSATWGELYLLEQRGSGWGLLGAAVLGGVALGIVRPLGQLGLDGPPSPAPDVEHGSAETVSFREIAALFSLLVAALLARAWALNQLPGTFDTETVGIMLGSGTLYGIQDYLRTEFLGTGSGVFHVGTQFLLYRLFGTSLYSVRLNALLWGVCAIPLLYGFVRRLAGKATAFLATALFAFAPEQLFWSRSENVHFSVVAPATIVIAYVTLRLVERLSVRSALAVAIAMPACRYVYTPAFILFAMPLIAFAHTLVFVRRAWRRATGVAPFLLAGLLLWFCSLSLVEYALRRDPGQPLRFVDPTRTHGVTAWRYDIPASAGVVDVLRRQAVRVLRNVGDVVRGMAVQARYTSHWYQRWAVAPGFETTVNVSLVVLLAGGLGLLIGQVSDRRAALLLIWIGIGLLPACMSPEPEARRLAILFPVLPVVAAVFLMTGLRAMREVGSVWVERLGTFGIEAVTVALAFTGLATHILLPIRTPNEDTEARFAKPAIERSDIILHNLHYKSGWTVALGSIPRLLHHSAGACFQYVAPADWPLALLFPMCNFRDPVYEMTLPPAERERRRAALDARRVAFLLAETPESRPQTELLARLYPAAVTRRETPDAANRALVSVEVPVAQIEARRLLEVRRRPGSSRPSPLMGVRSAEHPTNVDGAEVSGGLALTQDGWYRFQLEPAVPSARLTVGSATVSSEPKPYLAGIQPFSLWLPANVGPVAIRAVRVERGSESDERLERFLGPEATMLAAVPSPVVDAGYRDAELVMIPTGRVVDLGTADDGDARLLVRSGDGWRVVRVTREARSITLCAPAVAADTETAAMAVGRGGDVAVMSAGDVEIFGPDGRRRAAWKAPGAWRPTDLVLLPDGRLLLARPDRHVVEVYASDGRLLTSIDQIGAIPLGAPQGLALTPDGRQLAILEERSRILVVTGLDPGASPRLISVFRAWFAEEASVQDLKRASFDGSDILVVSHHAHPVPLRFTSAGRRVLSSRPNGEPGGEGIESILGTARAPQGLWALASEGRALYWIPHQEAAR